MRRRRPTPFSSSELPRTRFEKSSAAFVKYWYNAAVSIPDRSWIAKYWETLKLHGLVSGGCPYVDMERKRSSAWTREATGIGSRTMDNEVDLGPSLDEQIMQLRRDLQLYHPDRGAGNIPKFIEAKRQLNVLKRKWRACFV